MKKYILSIFTIVVPIAILIYFLFSNNNSQNIIFAIKSTKIRWLICGALSMFIYWVLESISLHMISNIINKKLKFINAFKTSMIGQLFNCITPFATGGQPMQAYCMVKYGISLGQASSILLIKFIIYQIVLTLYSLIALIFKFSFFASKVSKFSYLVLIGFIVNLFVVISLIGIGFFPDITKRIGIFFVHVFEKIKIVKNPQKVITNIEIEIANFSESIKFLKRNIWTIIQVSFVVFLQLTAFFIIPYFIFLALKISNVNLFTIISAGAFVLMITSFIPLPGGSGGAEAGFYLFFGMFFPQSGVIAIAILIWRMFTFYMPIIAGIIFSNIGKFKFDYNSYTAA